MRGNTLLMTKSQGCVLAGANLLSAFARRRDHLGSNVHPAFSPLVGDFKQRLHRTRSAEGLTIFVA